MSDTLVLTFAELEFVLRAGKTVLPVREQLRLKHLDDTLAAAGAASLLARGLCTVVDGDVVPGQAVMVVSAALHEATAAVTVLSVGLDPQTFVHFFVGDGIGVAIAPAGLGQYSVVALDPAVELASQVGDLVESILANADSGALVQAVRMEGNTAVVVARDGNGDWYVSDTDHSPDKGMPVTREAAIERVHAVVAGALVAGA